MIGLLNLGNQLAAKNTSAGDGSKETGTDFMAAQIFKDPFRIKQYPQYS